MLNQIDLARTDLNLLVLFETVMEERHVGRAAERLHLTPSAVSHGLGRLRTLLNDPLFLRTPKGVVPTARATDLAPPIADLLARARSVVATAAPFDPLTSTRRFVIGAPDGSSAVFLPPLLAALRAEAPTVDIGVRQLLPVAGQTEPERAWRAGIADLESRAMDVAVIPAGGFPSRFEARPIYEEDFVIAMRKGHAFGRHPDLEHFAAMDHLVVSMTGDAHGFVDEVLAREGRTRRVALTVPNFMFALAVVADSNLIAALPRRLVAAHGKRLGVVAAEPPLPLPPFRMHAVTPKVALMDAGLAWLIDLIGRTAPA